MLVMLRLNSYTRNSQKNKFLYSGIESIIYSLYSVIVHFYAIIALLLMPAKI